MTCFSSRERQPPSGEGGDHAPSRDGPISAVHGHRHRPHGLWAHSGGQTKPKVTNVQGDASTNHEKNKMQLYVIIPVVESLLQFLVQGVIIFNMVGPHLVDQERLKHAFLPVDMSSLCFDTSISSKALYAVQLLSSLASLCISFTL